jgi:hypothetical protein
LKQWIHSPGPGFRILLGSTGALATPPPPPPPPRGRELIDGRLQTSIAFSIVIGTLLAFRNAINGFKSSIAKAAAKSLENLSKLVSFGGAC